MSLPASYIQTSFNAGELGPLMMGRVDQAVYRDGCEICEAFVPLIQGPVLKAPGTIFVDHPAGECRLIEFVPFVTQAYMIEASDLVFRFYTNGARIETSPGIAYEVAHPYLIDELRAIDFQRSADVLYLFHPDFKQAKLSRTAAETFDLVGFDFQNGPFDDGNSNETITVTVNATTGSITVTSSAAIFKPGHVGGLFQIEAKDFSDIIAWEPGYKTISIGEKVRSEGKVYIATAIRDPTHPKTGGVQPTHTEGEEWDGIGGEKVLSGDVNGGGIKWRYLYDRFGIVKISAYTSPTVVTATVLRRLADSLTSVASWRWSFGAFSAENGWPSAGAIWDDRLVLAKGSQLFGSVVGDYENHRERDDTGQLTADMAFRVRLPDPNPIEWLRADKALLIGAADAEYAATRIQGSSIPQILRQSKYGSGGVRPVEAASRLLFVQRAGRKLRELTYSFQTDRYEAPDLTVIASHIGRNGLVELAYQQEPHSLVWAERGDGLLAMLVYSPTETVKGWARRPLGGDGLVEAIATMPNPAGDADEVWLSVNRSGTRTIEYMAPFWEPGDDPASSIFVDCAAYFEMFAPTTDFTGVLHLAGVACTVLADGAPHPSVTVAMDGSFSLTRAATKVVIGHGYTATLKTLRPEAPDQLGTWQGRMKQVVRVVARLLETLGIKLAVQGLAARSIEFRAPSDAMDQPVPLYTGDKVIDCVGEIDANGQVTYTSDQPLPACILANITQIAAHPK